MWVSKQDPLCWRSNFSNSKATSVSTSAGLTRFPDHWERASTSVRRHTNSASIGWYHQSWLKFTQQFSQEKHPDGGSKMNHDVLYRCCENRDPYPSSKFVRRRKLVSMNERTIASSYDLNYDRKNLTLKRIRCHRNRFFSTGIIFILAVLLFSAGDTVLAYHHRFPTMAKQRLFSRNSSTRFSERAIASRA